MQYDNWKYLFRVIMWAIGLFAFSLPFAKILQVYFLKLPNEGDCSLYAIMISFFLSLGIPFVTCAISNDKKNIIRVELIINGIFLLLGIILYAFLKTNHIPLL